jgi:hypothetical protein
MKADVYRNPLYASVMTGAVRVLKKVAVEAEDPDLAKLVKQLEQHYQERQQGEVADGTQE